MKINNKRTFKIIALVAQVIVWSFFLYYFGDCMDKFDLFLMGFGSCSLFSIISDYIDLLVDKKSGD